jgi:hypothetical protein
VKIIVITFGAISLLSLVLVFGLFLSDTAIYEVNAPKDARKNSVASSSKLLENTVGKSIAKSEATASPEHTVLVFFQASVLEYGDDPEQFINLVMSIPGTKEVDISDPMSGMDPVLDEYGGQAFFVVQGNVNIFAVVTGIGTYSLIVRGLDFQAVNALLRNRFYCEELYHEKMGFTEDILYEIGNSSSFRGNLVSVKNFELPEGDDVNISYIPKKVAAQYLPEDTYRKTLSASLDVDAQYEIALKFLDGARTRSDHSKGYDSLKLLADKGHAAAQYSLGLLYVQGLGVGKNTSLALSSFRMAAMQGHVDAQFALGVFYAEKVREAHAQSGRETTQMEEDSLLSEIWLTIAKENGKSNQETDAVLKHWSSYRTHLGNREREKRIDSIKSQIAVRSRKK